MKDDMKFYNPPAEREHIINDKDGSFGVTTSNIDEVNWAVDHSYKAYYYRFKFVDVSEEGGHLKCDDHCCVFPANDLATAMVAGQTHFLDVVNEGIPKDERYQFWGVVRLTHGEISDKPNYDLIKQNDDLMDLLNVAKRHMGPIIEPHERGGALNVLEANKLGKLLHGITGALDIPVADQLAGFLFHSALMHNIGGWSEEKFVSASRQMYRGAAMLHEGVMNDSFDEGTAEIFVEDLDGDGDGGETKH